jgi:hypothetical protein
MLKTVAAAALAAGLVATPALAKSGIKIGTLTCKVKDVTNVVVYTEQTFACTFDPANSDQMETYTGKIDKIGVDLSIKQDFTIIWAVIAPTEQIYQPRSLDGTYVGASADAAVGVGAGANVLVGGGENSFTLQPVSVSGVEGVGASIGIEKFELS